MLLERRIVRGLRRRLVHHRLELVVNVPCRRLVDSPLTHVLLGHGVGLVSCAEGPGLGGLRELIDEHARRVEEAVRLRDVLVPQACLLHAHVSRRQVLFGLQTGLTRVLPQLRVKIQLLSWLRVGAVHFYFGVI